MHGGDLKVQSIAKSLRNAANQLFFKWADCLSKSLSVFYVGYRWAGAYLRASKLVQRNNFQFKNSWFHSCVHETRRSTHESIYPLMQVP